MALKNAPGWIYEQMQVASFCSVENSMYMKRGQIYRNPSRQAWVSLRHGSGLTTCDRVQVVSPAWAEMSRGRDGWFGSVRPSPLSPLPGGPSCISVGQGRINIHPLSHGVKVSQTLDLSAIDAPYQLIADRPIMQRQCLIHAAYATIASYMWHLSGTHASFTTFHDDYR